jgi:hypothetical protein
VRAEHDRTDADTRAALDRAAEQLADERRRFEWAEARHHDDLAALRAEQRAERDRTGAEVREARQDADRRVAEVRALLDAQIADLRAQLERREDGGDSTSGGRPKK